MGSYENALAAGRAAGSAPDIVADDQPGRTKWGWGVNVEQPLADAGETGLFARLGGSDGRNESFAFTEADRHASAGCQLAGMSWRRPQDPLAAAVVQHELSALHHDCLAAGARGFLLGGGALSCGRETIGEIYYRVQVGALTAITADLQRIVNPGFNHDRGPATVAGVRLNVRY